MLKRTANKQTEENTRRRDDMNNLLGFNSDSLEKPYLERREAWGRPRLHLRRKALSRPLNDRKIRCFILTSRVVLSSFFERHCILSNGSKTRYWNGIRRMRHPGGDAKPDFGWV